MTLPLLAAVLLLTPASAQAQAQLRSGFCSPSGDYCKSTFREGGEQRFDLRTATLYGPGRAYTLCVRPPRGEETCTRFRLGSFRGIYRSTVAWSRHFPDAGAGIYRVRWRHGDATTRLRRAVPAYGPPLRFRRRA